MLVSAKTATRIQYLTLCLAIYMGNPNAQTTVFFSNQSNLLGNTTGFSYADCAVDMNGDNLDDIVRVTQEKIYIDYQQADGSFQQASFLLDVQNLPEWSICAGDLDNNGFNDLLFGAGNAVSFVMSNATGDGYEEFPDPTFIFSQRSTMADIDNDGHLDAFVCHDVDQSHPYRNDGHGNMVLDPSLIETADRPGNYAAIWTDYDNDGDIDLYITKCKGGASPGDIDRTNLLYRNNGDGTFSEIAEEAGVDDNAQSWSTVFEDFDNDGDFDAFIVNHDFKNRFYLNNGDGTFSDIIDQTGIDPYDLGAWENASGDFNNDGYMDIFSELSHQLYLNNGDLTFTGQPAPLTPGATGDFNNDGFLDIYHSGTLMINQGNANNWLKVNCVGTKSNRNGIGARVEIYGPWGIQVREIRSGQSFSPMSSLTLHFGLGTADQVDSLVVRWPSQIVTTVEGPEINTTLVLHEAGCLLPPASIMITGDLLLCPGDSVLLEGPAGYAYAWSNGDTTAAVYVQEPGNYWVVLTDSAGCQSFPDPVLIQEREETPPLISANGPLFFCEGGAVELTATGGTDYSWSNGLSGPVVTIDQPGTYTVTSPSFCGVDPLVSQAIMVSVLEALEPVVNAPQILPGDSLLLIATGIDQGTYYWYDAPAGGNLLSASDTFQTPPLTATTVYYVEAENVFPGEFQTGGKPDNTGGGGLPSQAGWSYFNAWEPFLLQSVRVYVPITAPSGIRTIQLYDGNNQLLTEKTVNLTSPGAYEIGLDFEIPQGTELSLRLPESNLFRNNQQVNYPYAVGDVGEITNSLFGLSYYYYFYDWKIRKSDISCLSDRVPVTVSVSSLEETGWPATIQVYPVPASDRLFVRIDRKVSELRLTDLAGRQVISQKTQGFESLEWQVGELPAGMYTLEVLSAEHTYRRKVLIR